MGCFKNFPECPRVIACDDGGYTHPSLVTVVLPFDTGLTAKRNAAVRAIHTRYTLMASDDYDFRQCYVRTGVERLVATLDAHPEVDVAVGTYNRKRYEGFLEYKPDEYIKEIALSQEAKPTFEKPYPAYKVDIGINYFVARTDVLRLYQWDESIRPIGGEHADWFLSLKKQGRIVVWVPDCYIENIRNIEGNKTWEHPDYRQYRWRAALTGHKIFLKKWHVKNYIGFNGDVS